MRDRIGRSRLAFVVTLSALLWAPAAVAAAQVTSRLTLVLPHEATEVALDGKTIPGSGTTREVDTPALVAGQMYRFTLTAEWRPNNYTVVTRTKLISLKAGERLTVDLTVDDPADRARIRYVPTPNEVVDEMIVLAGVTADDVVYEPGCGDARITIAAVKAGAKRGVGIDIDPDRVAESQRNVQAAGLEERVEIRLGDALDIQDLSTASVVFLYMGNEFDLLIRPILWKQLKVGARVVSHRFTMGDWKPDKSVSLDVEDEPYQVHLWTITDEIKRKAAGG